MLSIDVGTASTAAVVRWPDGRTRALLFDGEPLLDSAVAAGPDGTVLVGRDAQRVGRSHPGRYEPHLKQRIGTGRLRLGDHDMAVEALVAALLGRVADEAARTLGGPPGMVVLTHPAGWEPARRTVLLGAAWRAGLREPILVPEPAAAASYLLTLLGGRIPPDAPVLVYDLGAGTFDAALLRRTPKGFALVAAQSAAEVGGLDVDGALVDWIGHRHAGNEAWCRLAGPVDDAGRRAWWTLWQDVRVAKEILARSDSTVVHLPGLDHDQPLNRDHLDRAAGPVVERSLDLTLAVLGAGRVAPRQLATLLAVGGSSRLPLVPTALAQALGVTVTTTEQPDLVVAEGALYAVLASAPRPTVHLYRPGAARYAPARRAAPRAAWPR